ncbi:endoplasmic reticulum metallopeptidase 1-like [Abrus precatorius]|uniref:Vacuolar membrane protease n=1 Tax=Abrus precatorius TaxID=3816 RepID=A0A8B8MF02_ABRPR|nr:endoplasmic reticulum metallopeptidase 1-like [Abrus precatorius]
MFGSVASKVTSAASKVASSVPVPVPVTTKQETSFSEAEAFKHVNAFSQMASHPGASSHQNPALQYVLKESENIKETAHGDLKVELDLLPAISGGSDQKHVALKFLPKHESEVKNKSILVSAHVDTVFSEDANDNSNVAVMLELARGLSHAHSIKNPVIFFFNTSEEEGLDGSHSFITQHPFGETVRLAIDLDSIGLGEKSSTSEDSGLKDAFITLFDMEKEAQMQRYVLDLGAYSTYPRGSITTQDLFASELIASAPDFKPIQPNRGLSGLEFGFEDRGVTHHAKNKTLKPGSLQHLGENTLAFLLQTATTLDTN